MSAAQTALERLQKRIDLVPAGIGFAIVPAGEQQKHAAALARGPERTVVEMESLPGDGASRGLIIPGLPRDVAAAAKALAHLNGMRNRLIASGHVVILVLSRREMALAEEHAPDVVSAKIALEEVPFAPDPSVNEVAAREDLHRWIRERFGKLDLRGFIRSETEDVSWGIEELYQEVRGVTMEVSLGRGGDTRVIGHLKRERETVILGHPGSGKTFFLRWLALQMSREESFLDIERPLPFLCSLSAFAGAQGYDGLYDYAIDTMLEAGQGAAHHFDRAIAERCAVFLLDGLDEVGDEAARRRVVDAMVALRARAPGCLLVATSRIAGYDPALLPNALRVTLSPFEDGDVRHFLVQWSVLYARDRHGESAHAEEEGRSEGEKVASDVLAHHQIRELARTPLLLTVLAIVHRAGVRLPDHRIELYEHVTKVLVERWNRVRGLAKGSSAPPLKAADAVRLLGPVALRMVRSNLHGLVHETDLRRALDAALSTGTLRGGITTEDAIVLFRNTLGLLVEQAPGLYAFAHLTLAEYFAAWEIVRSNAIFTLINQETEVFYPRWREVILLAAGELGVIRADDWRLGELVKGLIQSAVRRPGKSSPGGVPMLLSGLLADDPGLSSKAMDTLVEELVPKWWFEQQYGSSGALELAVYQALTLVRSRISGGRAGDKLRQALTQAYGQGIPQKVFKNLARGGSSVLVLFLRFLDVAGVDSAPSRLIYESSGRRGEEASRLYQEYRLYFEKG